MFCLLQRFPSLFKTKLKQLALLTSYFWINEENILYVHIIQAFSFFLSFSSYITVSCEKDKSHQKISILLFLGITAWKTTPKRWWNVLRFFWWLFPFSHETVIYDSFIIVSSSLTKPGHSQELIKTTKNAILYSTQYIQMHENLSYGLE